MRGGSAILEGSDRRWFFETMNREHLSLDDCIDLAKGAISNTTLYRALQGESISENSVDIIQSLRRTVELMTTAPEPVPAAPEPEATDDPYTVEQTIRVEADDVTFLGIFIGQHFGELSTYEINRLRRLQDGLKLPTRESRCTSLRPPAPG